MTSHIAFLLAMNYRGFCNLRNQWWGILSTQSGTDILST